MPSMCGPGTMALVISGAAQIAELPDEYNRFTIYAAMVTAFALMSLLSWGCSSWRIRSARSSAPPASMP